MVDKIQYALALFDNKEILILFGGLIVYHVVILVGITLSVRSSLALRLKSLKQEKLGRHRDEGWKDREEELRRILNVERGREVSQLKAEYDSYIGLLEQKLAKARPRERSIP